MLACWSGQRWSLLKRPGASEPAGLACVRWRKRPPGSRGTANSGARVSTNWTRLSRTCNTRRRQMPEGKEGSPAMNRTLVERKSDRELVVARTFHAPAHTVFEAWSTPELFQRWWVPKSFAQALLSCDL